MCYHIPPLERYVHHEKVEALVATYMAPWVAMEF